MTKQIKVKTHVNRFKEYHIFLKEADNVKWCRSIDTICEQLNISTSTYYRKLDSPEDLSIADKLAIANIYKLPVHFLFPELENELA